jgi:ribosome-associated toxin RatA of RatAB toxin-antitoxin module
MGGFAGSASAEIAAPLDVVYSIVSDIAGYVVWQPGLDAATILERDRWQRQTLVRVEMTRGGRPIRSDLRFSYEPGARVSWFQEQGDASRFDGTWTLESVRLGVVRATYAIELDLGRILGLMMSGRLAAKLGERFIDPMPLRLRQHVESLQHGT